MSELEGRLGFWSGETQERTGCQGAVPTPALRGPSTISTGPLDSCAISYLVFIFKAAFPFSLNKFSLKGDFYYSHKQKISITCHK